MRRRNRKITKTKSVAIAATTHGFVIILALFTMVMAYHVADSRNQQLQTEIGKCERQLAMLESDLTRTSSRWQLLRDPSRLDAALLKHGLSMKLPRADQNIQMRKDGTLYPFAGKVGDKRSSRSAAYKSRKQR